LQADPRGLQAYADRATTGLQALYPDSPRIFFTGLRAGPTGHAQITTPINYHVR